MAEITLSRDLLWKDRLMLRESLSCLPLKTSQITREVFKQHTWLWLFNDHERHTCNIVHISHWQTIIILISMPSTDSSLRQKSQTITDFSTNGIIFYTVALMH